MADPDVQVRVKNLEDKLKLLNDALATETRNRETAKADSDQQLRLLADLLSDNNNTVFYTIKYLSTVDAQYYAKGLTLQEAIENFNKFLSLPPKSNKFVEIWTVAWEIVAITVPALRLSSLFTKLEKAAQIEMTSAKAFMKTPELVARITTYAAKGHNIAEVIRKGNSIADKASKATVGSTNVPLDKNKKPVGELIKASNQAHMVLDKVIDTLDAEFAARLNSLLYKVPYASKETLLAMAKRLLPPLPQFLGSNELEQTGRLYLWTILGNYAKLNVTIVKTESVYPDSYSIDGFNDSQMDQIMEWFGYSSNWAGVPVRVHPILNIYYALWKWNVETTTKWLGGTFGYG